MLNSEFDEFAENDLPDLYPAPSTLIDELNDRIYKTVNNGVYRCGFAKTQEAYDEHIGPMFETFDHLEELLSNQRYLITSYPTEADRRLFVTLIRLTVYFSHFNVISGAFRII